MTKCNITEWRDSVHSRYQTIFKYMIDGTISTDAHGIISTFNPAAENMFGYRESEVIGKNINILVPEPHKTKHDGYLEKYKQNNTSVDGLLREVIALKKDGSVFPAELSISEMSLNGKRYFNSIIRDITERKKVEQALRNQLEYAKSITRIADLINHEESPQEILNGMTRIVGTTLQVDRALIYDIDFIKNQAIGLSEYLNPNIPDIDPTLGTYPLDMFRSGCTYILTEKTYIESHVDAINRLFFEDGSAEVLHVSMNIKSLLWYPFKYDEQGFFLLVFNQVDYRREWTGEDIQFLEAVFRHVSNALRQIKLLRERKEDEQQLLLAAIAFDAYEAIFITDERGIIQRVNHAFTRITGFTSEDVIGKSPCILQSGRHDRKFYDNLWSQLLDTGNWQGEIWNKHKNGTVYPQWESITAVKNASGKVTHYIAFFKDITQRKISEAQIQRLAYYDGLTELPNRSLLLNRLRQELLTAKRNGVIGGILFLDLDRFKTINDSKGHSVGDELLKQVSIRLLKHVRATDTVARLGGDEFVILLPDLGMCIKKAGSKIQAIAEKIQGAHTVPYNLDSHEYLFTLSIGIALYPQDGDNPGELLKHADTAMYYAKAKGRNVVQFYRPAMQITADVQLALEKDLGQALVGNQMKIYFQPQVDNLGNIVGAEALLRWFHPVKGIINPGTFISLAEETGQIIPIGNWVLENSLAYMNEMIQQNKRFEKLTFSINVSPLQFNQEKFVEQTLYAIRYANISPSAIKLEITENILMGNLQDIADKMSALKQEGISFVIDDFGTGFSSLAYLKSLPLDQLKIDRSFVQDIATVPNNAAIVETIIAMANHLDVEVIAEGVETAHELAFLQSQGCKFFQGYKFSKPLPVRDFVSLVSNIPVEIEI